MVKTKQQLVTNLDNTYGTGNPANFITIHETDNYDKGTGAQTHANLQSNGFSATWQWSVDDTIAVQSFRHNVRCWHAGDGNGKGNNESIGIEICVNPDSDFKEAVRNAAELTKWIMQEENIPLTNVVQHNRWSGKDCPDRLRSGSKGIDWGDFINLVNGTETYVPPEKETKPEKVTKPSKASGRLESKVNGLRFYNKPSWDDKDVVGTVDKGYGFPTTIKKIKVDSAYQYQVKNSKGVTYYITAADKYVKFDGKVSTSKPASKPKPKPSGIKTVGHIKIVNVSNAAYICDRPSSSNSKNLATAKKGSKWPIAGSVPGWWEIIYKGKRAYVNEKYGKRV